MDGQGSLMHVGSEGWPVWSDPTDELLSALLLSDWWRLVEDPAFSSFSNTPTIMALARNVYNLLFRRTSTFAITIMVGAVLFERVFDQGGDALFDSLNRG
ncbi:hypothetical protein QTP86_029770, partial [Hemibagrus guttatus]